ncbi:hypothetical protein PS850_04927 [Pseudomonas fluorescens]|nr:hypothetical protein PS850_04927 [Pseudomonas fluorescens]
MMIEMSPMVLQTLGRANELWTCPYKTGHQLPVKLMQLPSA